MPLIDSSAEFVLWGCIGVVAYVYLGYPLTLRLLPARPARALPAPFTPSVTVVIAAFNEVRQITATVRNKLAQDYPADRLEVVVVSDGSDDGTDDAVLAIGDARVTLLRQDPRQGKTMALNLALRRTTRDIVVFSDANSLYESRAVARLVSAFDDPTVGYATGTLRYRDPGSTAVNAGPGIYMRYENWLRRLESRVGSVVGVNGGIDAVRRTLYAPMRADHLPDFILPVRVVAQGYRACYQEDAVSTEEALSQQADEYRMRVRVSLRALHALVEVRSMLLPQHGLFAFQLFVHKVLRYLLVMPIAGAFLANSLLVHRPPYALTMGLQLTAYGLAAVGWASGGRIRWKPVLVPFYFCLVNAAAALALVRYCRGERTVIWTPRKGA